MVITAKMCGRLNPVDTLVVFFATSADTADSGVSSWIAITISVAALAVSVWSSFYAAERSRRTANQMAMNANYSRIHELLVDPKAAAGRRMLFISAKDGSFPRLGEPRWDHINYALALYDTLGGYIRRGLIDKELALSAWYDPLRRIAAPARAFAERRQDGHSNPPWAHLMWLLTEAEEYRPRI